MERPDTLFVGIFKAGLGMPAFLLASSDGLLISIGGSATRTSVADSSLATSGFCA